MNERPQNQNLRRGGPGRKKGVPNKRTLEIAQAARALVESREYRASLKKRLIEGKAPHMEPVLFYYAYGKPVEHHEVSGPDGGPIEVTAARDRVIRRLEEMAARLAVQHHAITSGSMGESSGNGAAHAAE